MTPKSVRVTKVGLWRPGTELAMKFVAHVHKDDGSSEFLENVTAHRLDAICAQHVIDASVWRRDVRAILNQALEAIPSYYPENHG